MSSSSRSKAHLTGEAGFTLLEMLIAMAILVFISVAIYQLTTSTFKLRDTLLTEGDFHNSIRLAMNIVERDVSMIYSPLAVVPDKKGKTQRNPQDAGGFPGGGNPFGAGGIPGDPRAQQGNDQVTLDSGEFAQSSKYWAQAIDVSGIRPTHFIGTDNAISFVASSNIRIYKNSKESEFAKISYRLERDDTVKDGEAYVLIKTEGPSAFDMEEGRDKSTRGYPLLRGIRKLTYRYWSREKKDWLRSWDSEKTEPVKNVYPDAIELKIEVMVTTPVRHAFEGTYIMRPEMPLNGLDTTI